MTLEQFTQELKSDEMWLEAMRNPSRGKSLAAAIEKVYGQVVSDQTIKTLPITEHRKHVFNTLGKMPFGTKATGVQLQQEPVKVLTHEEVKRESVDYETHQKRLKDWLDEIAKAPDHKRVPKLTSKEIQEEGQWDKKKPDVYRPDPITNWRIEKKAEYGRLFSDMRSFDGRLIPGSPSFEDWIQTQEYGKQ